MRAVRVSVALQTVVPPHLCRFLILIRNEPVENVAPSLNVTLADSNQLDFEFPRQFRRQISAIEDLNFGSEFKAEVRSIVNGSPTEVDPSVKVNVKSLAFFPVSITKKSSLLAPEGQRSFDPMVNTD